MDTPPPPPPQLVLRLPPRPPPPPLLRLGTYGKAAEPSCGQLIGRGCSSTSSSSTNRALAAAPSLLLPATATDPTAAVPAAAERASVHASLHHKSGKAAFSDAECQTQSLRLSKHTQPLTLHTDAHRLQRMIHNTTKTAPRGHREHPSVHHCCHAPVHVCTCAPPATSPPRTTCRPS